MSCAICFKYIYTDEFDKCKCCGVKSHKKCFSFNNKKYCFYCQHFFIKERKQIIAKGKCYLCPVNCGVLINFSKVNDNLENNFVNDQEEEYTGYKSFNGKYEELPWVHVICSLYHPQLQINGLKVNILFLFFRNV